MHLSEGQAVGLGIATAVIIFGVATRSAVGPFFRFDQVGAAKQRRCLHEYNPLRHNVHAGFPREMRRRLKRGPWAMSGSGRRSRTGGPLNGPAPWPAIMRELEKLRCATKIVGSLGRGG